jgi:hypothetical protein
MVLREKTFAPQEKFCILVGTPANRRASAAQKENDCK